MSATLTVSKVGTYSYKYEWTGTSPYDVWCDGEQLYDDTTETYCILEGDDAVEGPPVEVQDSTESDPQNSLYPPRFTLVWRQQNDAEYYVIQQYVGAVWTTIGSMAETDAGYYVFETLALADATTHTFQIVPYDAQDIAGSVLPYTVLMTRNPDPPSVTISWTVGTHSVTATAR